MLNPHLSAGHDASCRQRLAAECPIPVECPHGYDVCPECDPCTCVRVFGDPIHLEVPELFGGNVSTEMMTTRDHNGDDLTLTDMYGGTKNGRCVQVTVNDSYVVLTPDRVREVRDTLTNWLRLVDDAYETTRPADPHRCKSGHLIMHGYCQAQRHANQCVCGCAECRQSPV